MVTYFAFMSGILKGLAKDDKPHTTRIVPEERKCSDGWTYKVNDGMQAYRGVPHRQSA